MNKTEQEEVFKYLKVIKKIVDNFFVYRNKDMDPKLKEMISILANTLIEGLRHIWKKKDCIDVITSKRMIIRYTSQFTFECVDIIYLSNEPQILELLMVIEFINQHILDEFNPLKLKRIVDIM